MPRHAGGWRRLTRWLPIGVIAVAIAVAPAGDDKPAKDQAVFHKPVRLKADGEFIDTGEAWGHSGPWVADVDGDGLRDLIVGDFSGQFRVYKNTGGDNEPKYAKCEYLKAGGEIAKVPIY